MKDKKKMIISVISVIVVLVIIFAIIINKKVDAAMNKKYETLPEIELSEVFETDNIYSIEGVKLEKASNINVASKYVVGSNLYVLKADVKLENRTGKLIFLRDGYNNKVNIYQTKYGVDELGNISSQISQYMEDFKMNCTMLMGAVLDKPSNEVLFNKDDYDKNIPIEESIFNKNKLYSLTYKVSEDNLQEDDSSENEKKYEINFYRNGSYLMCEFVKIF